MKPGQIVILNGAPRSGKSSIVQAIQESFEGVWMNLGVDRFMPMTPKQYQPGMGLRPGGERPDLEPLLPLLYGALYDSIAAHSRIGLNVVADVGHHDYYSQSLNMLPDCASRLAGLPTLFVGAHCPLEVILKRREETGYPGGEPVVRWQESVHAHGLYDLELDTSIQAPEECAEVIWQRLENGPPGTALPTLAKR
ncbi:MAG: hypothetical protein QM758_30205 [Armatimonas sp.]